MYVGAQTSQEKEGLKILLEYSYCGNVPIRVTHDTFLRTTNAPRDTFSLTTSTLRGKEPIREIEIGGIARKLVLSRRPYLGHVERHRQSLRH